MRKFASVAVRTSSSGQIPTGRGYRLSTVSSSTAVSGRIFVSCNIHCDFAAIQITSVHSPNRVVSLLAVLEGDKAKSSRSSILVFRQVDIDNATISTEFIFQVLAPGLEAQIADVQTSLWSASPTATTARRRW